MDTDKGEKVKFCGYPPPPKVSLLMGPKTQPAVTFKE
jgi:hypothetical protein